jgi:exopolysaccharide production protein ExoZ
VLGRLQILRAVAAYMVVIFHCFEFLAASGFGLPQLRVGAAGVDLFFVISGFIMVYIVGVRETPAGFLMSRIGRIVPLYWLATLATVLAVLVRPWLFPVSLVTWQTVVSSLAFIPVPDAHGNLMPVLQVGWTLNWEMAFYVLFSLSLAVSARYRLLALLSLMTALFLAGRVAPPASFATFYGSPIIFEFAAGCLIGRGLQIPAIAAKLKRLPAMGLIVIGAFLLLAPGLLRPENSGLTSESDWMRPLVWGVPAVVIVLGVLLLDTMRAPAKQGLLTALGDASYSAYLLHPFMVTLLAVFVPAVLGVNDLSAAVFVVGTLVATMGGSMLSYRFFELPVHRLVRRCLRPALAR